MRKTFVADINARSLDSTGVRINTVYSKITGVFAVYGTSERVMIQYADKDALGIEQRRALAPLYPLRGEINGLVDVWRNSRRAKDLRRARIFDRRTADALIAALQGDRIHGEELLKAVRADVLEERISVGRVEYLRYATLAAILVLALFALLVGRTGDVTQLGGYIRQEHIWLAAGMGCLGALFSIALSIRSREIRTDLQRRDNITDAILRIMIGAVSAILLFSFIRSDLIKIEGLSFVDEERGFLDHTAIVVGFLAGFSERLVSGYLTKTTEFASGAAIMGAGGTSAAAHAAAQPEVEANERNPRGKMEVDVAGAAAETTDDADEHIHADDDGGEGCMCGETLDEAEITDDVELPEANGGVEKVAA